MARLSEEHFKGNTLTPMRKSSRLKDIFRPRQSLSVSSASPNLLIKFSPVTSPLASPTMKLGFEKVGLLPSERSSLEAAKQELENNAGMAVSEGLKKKVQDVKGASAPQSLDKERDVSGAPHAIEIAKDNECAEWERIVELVKAEEGAERDDSIKAGLRAPFLDTATTKPDCAKAKPSKPAFEGPQHVPVVTLVNSDDSVNYSDGVGHRLKPTASNIVDGKNPLSQSVRKDGSSKIVEVLLEHEGKSTYQHPKTTSAPVQFTINLNISGLAKLSRFDLIESTENRPYELDGPRRIGPFTINHPRIAADLQLIVIAVYIIILIGAALLGPKTLLFTLWRIGILLAGYAYVLGLLGWNDDAQSDVVLSPVYYVGRGAQHLSARVVKNLGAAVIPVLVEMLQDVATDVEATQNEK